MRCVAPKLVWPHRSIDWEDSHESGGMLVPCGKCVACLVNRRLDWIFRLEQEHRVSSSAAFVTLTYDAKHMRSDISLDKRDVQLYLKRLRKKLYGTRVRYFAVGEYGTKFGRPHYHLLLFNCTEEAIRSSWTDSKGRSIGIVHVGKVSSASISYCTKYIIQKGDFPEGKEKPFSLMSRGYGIGGHYLSDEMVEWHRSADRNWVVKPGGVRGKLPRFYRDKIWYKEADRVRVSSSALVLSLSNQIKEIDYYKEKFGESYELQMRLARQAVIDRVKQKVSFTQTF